MGFSVSDIRRYGRWVATGHSEGKKDGHRRTLDLCICDCNSTAWVTRGNLRNGTSRSCGCLRSEATSARCRQHDGRGTALYEAWKNMRARCYRRNRPDFCDYGGRGIRACDEWNNYPAFRDWAIGAGYCEGLSLDRINVDGDYEPSNCRWTDWFTQARNKRNNHVVTAFGETKTLADWAEDSRCAVSYHTLKARLNVCNMKPEYALTAPIHRLRRKVART